MIYVFKSSPDMMYSICNLFTMGQQKLHVPPHAQKNYSSVRQIACIQNCIKDDIYSIGNLFKVS